MEKIPVSVLVTTKNEENNIGRCLAALQAFAEIVVIDSNSNDQTQTIARAGGAQVVAYTWNGLYPKKRQWCLDHLDLLNDWIFFVDADEVIPEELIQEIRALFDQGTPDKAGFFVRGRYIWNGKMLNHGMVNNKIALLDRRRMFFPVIDDLDIEGMGEMEGHYQPVLKNPSDTLGQITAPLLHFAYEDSSHWHARHMRYARWEAEMTHRKAWPQDPSWNRELAKVLLRRNVLRPYIMFLYSYVWKAGVLDGRAGLKFAYSRYLYCRMIRKLLYSLST